MADEEPVSWFGGMRFTMKDVLLICGVVATLLGTYYKAQATAESTAAAKAREAAAAAIGPLEFRLAAAEAARHELADRLETDEARIDQLMMRAAGRERSRGREDGRIWQ